jgi:2-polyprenyl-3-methyl-5-hydroxy-6-metoxy-1,4-benzoquinol methylase
LHSCLGSLGTAVFELGYGNGSFAKVMSERGYAVTTIDTSIDGIKLARVSFPRIAFYNGSAYADLNNQFDKYNVLVSLEVVEHIFALTRYVATVYELLGHGRAAIFSTSYHSYVKNFLM